MSDDLDPGPRVDMAALARRIDDEPMRTTRISDRDQSTSPDPIRRDGREQRAAFFVLLTHSRDKGDRVRIAVDDLGAYDSNPSAVVLVE